MVYQFILKKKGRKTRIKRFYIEFVSRLLEKINTNELIYSKNIHMKLENQFEELKNNMFSLTTTQEIIKRAGFSYKRTCSRHENAMQPKIRRSKGIMQKIFKSIDGKKKIYILR